MATKLFAGHRNCIQLQPGWTDFTAPELSFLQLLHFDMLLFLMQHINKLPVNRGKLAKERENSYFFFGDVSEVKMEWAPVLFFESLNHANRDLW